MEGRINSNPQTDKGQFQTINGDLYIPSIPLGGVNDYYLVINPDSKQVKYISLFENNLPITGSLFGTASWALSASQALTASFLPVGIYNITASWAQNVIGGGGGGISSQITTGSITASVNIGADTFRVQSGSSTFLYISSSGNVGIGTTSPTLGLLQLNSNASVTNPSLYINALGVGTTASIIVRSSNGGTANQKTYNPIGGSDSLNFIQLLDGDATTQTNQPIGRIIFSSNDTDTTGSGTTKAFIEAVAEDATPDVFLAFGTNQSGSLVAERMRITSTGNVGIGTTTPTNTLEVNGGITATSLYIIQKASIGTTHQSASLTISASSAEDAILVKINDTNVTDKFKINNEGIMVLGKLDNSPLAVEGGIFFSSSNDYFLGFS